jgi:dTMP kinase
MRMPGGREMSSARSTALGGLIAVSGVDGSGKSTLVSAFAQSLRSSGTSVEALAALKSPQFSPFTLLKDIDVPSTAKPSRESWIAGYFALVLLHNLSTVIAPAIAAGTWIVTDRWTLDHHAIQLTLGIDMTPWLPLLRCAPKPDLHLFLDLPLDVAQRRIDKRGEPGVGAGQEYLQQCRETMQSLAKSPDYSPVVVIDADVSPPELLDRVLKATRGVMSGRTRAIRPGE